LKLEKVNGLLSKYPFDYFLKQTTAGKKEGYGPLSFITREELNKFLKGKKISTVIELEKLMVFDNRIHISKDPHSGTAEDGKLQRVSYADTTFYEDKIRKDTLKKIHFNITITGLKIPETHGRRLGGEGKIAFLNVDYKTETETDTLENILVNNDEISLIY